VIIPDDLDGVKLSELTAATNWQQQYRLIIQWGKLVCPKPEMRLPEHLIKGCELPVWLAHEQQGEQYYFAFDSDSSVMNGLAVLLLVQVNSKTRDEVTSVDLLESLRELGFEKHLTPSRNSGLAEIIKRIHNLVG